MEIHEITQLISQAKNVCLIPSHQNEPESLSSALALFYTLKDLHKNVNLLIEEFPERLNFLVPSIDSISSPKNLVISIPRSTANVSQVYYEKNEDQLKIHLTIDKGHIKKEHISFYFANPKPDVVITVGVSDMQAELSKLDAFGFILDTPIINIDNHIDNKKFGKINIVGSKSLAEHTLEVIQLLDPALVKKDAATCLLTGLMLYYENFKSPKTNATAFQIASELTQKGALHQHIVDNLYKASEKETQFFYSILQHLKANDNQVVPVSLLDSNEFETFSAKEASTAVEKIKMLGIQNDLLVLWKSHASAPMIKGFLYSKKDSQLDKVSHSRPQSNWVFLEFPGENINATKEQIITLLNHHS